MNPPFGACSERTEDYCRTRWGSLANDLYVLFFVRVSSMLAPGGRVGAITSRGFLAGRDQRDFRPLILGRGSARLERFVDMGLAVLDGAEVETALSVMSAPPDVSDSIAFLDLRAAPRVSLSIAIADAVRAQAFVTGSSDRFLDLPSAPILYTASLEELTAIAGESNIDPDLARVTRGLQTSDNDRFLRLYWEVSPHEIGNRWRYCAKGGEYRWIMSNIQTIVDWKNDGEHVAAHMANISTNIAQARRSSKYYGMAGVPSRIGVMTFR